jgi:hypothetical protein
MDEEQLEFPDFEILICPLRAGMWQSFEMGCDDLVFA